MTFKFNSGAGGSVKLNSRRFPSTGVSAYQPTQTSGGGITGRPWFDPAQYGSTLFNGNVNSYADYSSDGAFNFSGDFTIEWWQYQTDNNPFPRPFAFGAYPDTKLGVSLEGSTFVLWGNGSTVMTPSIPGDLKNKCVHIAISRQSGTVRVFINGKLIGTTDDGGVGYVVSGIPLTLGKGGPTSYAVETFGGWLSHFRISNTTRYVLEFTPTTTPFINDANTIFLHRSVGYNIEGIWSGNVSASDATPDSPGPFPAV